MQLTYVYIHLFVLLAKLCSKSIELAWSFWKKKPIISGNCVRSRHSVTSMSTNHHTNNTNVPPVMCMKWSNMSKPRRNTLQHNGKGFRMWSCKNIPYKCVKWNHEQKLHAQAERYASWQWWQELACTLTNLEPLVASAWLWQSKLV